MAEFNAGSIEATLELNRDPFIAGLAAARQEADAFERDPITVPLRVEADKESMPEAEAELESEIKDLHAPVKAEARTDTAAPATAAIQAAVGDVTAPVKAEADIQSAPEASTELQAEVRDLTALVKAESDKPTVPLAEEEMQAEVKDITVPVKAEPDVPSAPKSVAELQEHVADLKASVKAEPDADSVPTAEAILASIIKDFQAHLRVVADAASVPPAMIALEGIARAKALEVPLRTDKEKAMAEAIEVQSDLQHAMRAITAYVDVEPRSGSLADAIDYLQNETNVVAVHLPLLPEIDQRRFTSAMLVLRAAIGDIQVPADVVPDEATVANAARLMQAELASIIALVKARPDIPSVLEAQAEMQREVEGTIYDKLKAVADIPSVLAAQAVLQNIVGHTIEDPLKALADLISVPEEEAKLQAAVTPVEVPIKLEAPVAQAFRDIIAAITATLGRPLELQNLYQNMGGIIRQLTAEQMVALKTALQGVTADPITIRTSFDMADALDQLEALQHRAGAIDYIAHLLVEQGHPDLEDVEAEVQAEADAHPVQQPVELDISDPDAALAILRQRLLGSGAEVAVPMPVKPYADRDALLNLGPSISSEIAQMGENITFPLRWDRNDVAGAINAVRHMLDTGEIDPVKLKAALQVIPVEELTPQALIPFSATELNAMARELGAKLTPKLSAPEWAAELKNLVGTMEPLQLPVEVAEAGLGEKLQKAFEAAPEAKAKIRPVIDPNYPSNLYVEVTPRWRAQTSFWEAFRIAEQTATTRPMEIKVDAQLQDLYAAMERAGREWDAQVYAHLHTLITQITPEQIAQMPEVKINALAELVGIDYTQLGRRLRGRGEQDIALPLGVNWTLTTPDILRGPGFIRYKDELARQIKQAVDQIRGINLPVTVNQPDPAQVQGSVAQAELLARERARLLGPVEVDLDMEPKIDPEPRKNLINALNQALASDPDTIAHLKDTIRAISVAELSGMYEGIREAIISRLNIQYTGPIPIEQLSPEQIARGIKESVQPIGVPLKLEPDYVQNDDTLIEVSKRAVRQGGINIPLGTRPDFDSEAETIAKLQMGLQAGDRLVIAGSIGSLSMGRLRQMDKDIILRGIVESLQMDPAIMRGTQEQIAKAIKDASKELVTLNVAWGPSLDEIEARLKTLQENIPVNPDIDDTVWMAALGRALSAMFAEARINPVHVAVEGYPVMATVLAAQAAMQKEVGNTIYDRLVAVPDIPSVLQAQAEMQAVVGHTIEDPQEADAQLESVPEATAEMQKVADGEEIVVKEVAEPDPNAVAAADAWMRQQMAQQPPITKPVQAQVDVPQVAAAGAQVNKDLAAQGAKIPVTADTSGAGARAAAAIQAQLNATGGVKVPVDKAYLTDEILSQIGQIDKALSREQLQLTVASLAWSEAKVKTLARQLKDDLQKNLDQLQPALAAIGVKIPRSADLNKDLATLIQRAQAALPPIDAFLEIDPKLANVISVHSTLQDYFRRNPLKTGVEIDPTLYSALLKQPPLALAQRLAEAWGKPMGDAMGIAAAYGTQKNMAYTLATMAAGGDLIPPSAFKKAGGDAGDEAGQAAARTMTGGIAAGILGFSWAHLATAAVPLVISAVSAAMGGALLGGAALAVGAVGFGTDLAGIGQAAGDIRQTYTAMNNLNQAIAVYGRGSQQAITAQQQLNYTLAGFNPVARSAVAAAAATAAQAKQLFDQYTGYAEKTGAEIINQLLQTGEKFIPTIGKFATENMAIIQKGIQPFLSWLSGRGLQIFTDLEVKFQQGLAPGVDAMSKAFEIVAEVIDHIVKSDLGNFMQRIDDYVTKWDTPTGLSRIFSEVDRLIGDFRVWWGLIKAVFDVFMGLVHAEAGTGITIVEHLTAAANKLADYLKTSQGFHEFNALFTAHRNQIIALGHAIDLFLQQAGIPLINMFTSLSKAVTPFIPIYGEFMGLLIRFLADIVDFIAKIPGLGPLLGFLVVMRGFQSIPWFGIGKGFETAFAPMRWILTGVGMLITRIPVLGDAIVALLTKFPILGRGISALLGIPVKIGQEDSPEVKLQEAADTELQAANLNAETADKNAATADKNAATADKMQSAGRAQEAAGAEEETAGAEQEVAGAEEEAAGAEQAGGGLLGKVGKGAGGAAEGEGALAGEEAAAGTTFGDVIGAVAAPLIGGLVGGALGGVLAHFTEAGKKATDTVGRDLTTAGGAIFGAGVATGNPFIALPGLALVAAGEVVAHWQGVVHFFTGLGGDISHIWDGMSGEKITTPAQEAQQAFVRVKSAVDSFKTSQDNVATAQQNLNHQIQLMEQGKGSYAALQSATDAYNAAVKTANGNQENLNKQILNLPKTPYADQLSPQLIAVDNAYNKLTEDTAKYGGNSKQVHDDEIALSNALDTFHGKQIALATGYQTIDTQTQNVSKSTQSLKSDYDKMQAAVATFKAGPGLATLHQDQLNVESSYSNMISMQQQFGTDSWQYANAQTAYNAALEKYGQDQSTYSTNLNAMHTAQAVWKADLDKTTTSINNVVTALQNMPRGATGTAVIREDVNKVKVDWANLQAVVAKGYGPGTPQYDAAYNKLQADLKATQTAEDQVTEHAKRQATGLAGAWDIMRRDFFDPIGHWFSVSFINAFTNSPFSRFFTSTIPHYADAGWQGFDRDFAQKLAHWFGVSVVNAFTNSPFSRFFTNTIPNLATSGWQGFDRDFAQKIGNFFSVSFVHAFTNSPFSRFFTNTIPSLATTGWQGFNNDLVGPIGRFFSQTFVGWFTNSPFSRFFTNTIPSLAVQGWQGFNNDLVGPIGRFFSQTFVGFFSNSPFSRFFTDTIPNLATTGWNGFYNNLVRPFINFFGTTLPNFFTQVIPNAISSLVRDLGNIKIKVPSWIPGIGGDTVSFQVGGVVPGQIGQPRLAVVHGGERIVPVGGNPQGVSAGGGTTFNITINNPVGQTTEGSIHRTMQKIRFHGLLPVETYAGG